MLSPVTPQSPGPKCQKNVSAICHIQFQWKVTEHFRIRIKKICIVRTGIALIEKIFRKKNFADKVLLFMCKSTHCQNLGAIGQISYEV